MPTPDIAIRAKRKLTNRLIAARDSARLRPHLTDDMLLIAGDGAPIHGAEAVIAAFASQFADPAFVAYERTTDTVSWRTTASGPPRPGVGSGAGRTASKWAASTWPPGASTAASGGWSASCT